MTQEHIPAIAIVGRSKVGKTSLIEKLIPVLIRKGLNVATIKHHLHNFEIDYPGKDSFRHQEAGAKLTMIASPNKIALVERLDKEMGVEELCARYIHDMDIVIVEGFKATSLPKIEVFQKKVAQIPVCRHDRNLIAVVTDDPIDMPIPTFHTNDIEAIAGFIINRFVPTGRN